MKIDKSQKQEILYQSFVALKDEWEEDGNDSNITELIANMAEIDLNIALDMWKYILQNNSDHVVGNKGKDRGYSKSVRENFACKITSDVLDEIKNKCDIFDLANAIINDNCILEQLFGLSACINESQISIISEFINRGSFDNADKLLQFVYNNPNNKAKGNEDWSNSFGTIIQKLIDEISQNDESVQRFIYDWIQRIADPKEKAKANIRYTSLF